MHCCDITQELGCIVAMARGLLLTQQGRFDGQNVLLIVAYSGEGLK